MQISSQFEGNRIDGGRCETAAMLLRIRQGELLCSSSTNWDGFGWNLGLPMLLEVPAVETPSKFQLRTNDSAEISCN